MSSEVKQLLVVYIMTVAIAVVINACSNTGEWCQLDIECCGAAKCHKGICRIMRCRPTGYRCKYHNECCQGFCRPSTPNVKLCAKPNIDDINAYLEIIRRANW